MKTLEIVLLVLLGPFVIVVALLALGYLAQIVIFLVVTPVFVVQEWIEDKWNNRGSQRG